MRFCYFSVVIMLNAVCVPNMLCEKTYFQNSTAGMSHFFPACVALKWSLLRRCVFANFPDRNGALCGAATTAMQQVSEPVPVVHHLLCTCAAA